MAVTLNKKMKFLKQWIQDTANIKINDSVLESFINKAYIKIASVLNFDSVRLEFDPITDQRIYPTTAMGSDNDISENFMQPIRVLYVGSDLKEMDSEELEYKGFLVPDLKSGTPEAFSWYTGDLTIYPAPDVSATENKITLIYANFPGELTSGSSEFSHKFRPQWQEALDWKVLEFYVAALPVDKQKEISFSLNFISAMSHNILEKARLDKYNDPSKTYKFKSRASAKDAKYFTDNLGIN